MKADRLLSALLLLQAHGRLSSRDLAMRLDVSERTAHRDMESLCVAGVPVFATRGSKGGWQLEEGWRTRVPGLDDEELRALLLTQARAIAEPTLAAFAERAITKLTASLPAPMRERAASLRKRLLVDTAGWFGREENLSALPAVQDAVSSERLLSIRYHPPGREPSDRRVGPLGLVAKGTVWYLVASAPNGLRTYRVSRIESATLLAEPFLRPAEFDLARYWESQAAQLRASRHFVADLRMKPDTADSVRTWCRVVTDAPVREEDGWVTLRVDFDNESHAAFVVMGLGGTAEVLAPPVLRERVAQQVREMFDRLQPIRRGTGRGTPAASPEKRKGRRS